MSKKLIPIHLGEVLLKEFVKPMKLNQCEFAADLQVGVRGLPECEVELSDGGCVTWLKI